MTAPAALELRRLSKQFGSVQALSPLTLQIQDGERVGVIGPNGAGKTTLFALISGELAPGEGEVLLAGRRVTRTSPQGRARMGLGRTFQSARLFARMSARENVELALLAAFRRNPPGGGRGGAGRREAARHALAEVGLDGDAARTAHELPQGQRKRLELAMALAGEPRVLLLDEPTAGMGLQERAQIMELVVASAARRGATVVFTEHDMGAVFAHAGRIVALDRGEVIADGPPAAVRADPRVRAVYLGGEEEE